MIQIEKRVMCVQFISIFYIFFIYFFETVLYFLDIFMYFNIMYDVENNTYFSLKFKMAGIDWWSFFILYFFSNFFLYLTVSEQKKNCISRAHEFSFFSWFSYFSVFCLGIMKQNKFIIFFRCCKNKIHFTL